MTDQADHGLTEDVERLALTSGASLVGFADLEGLADLPRAVALAVRYAPEVFADPEHMPNPAFAGEFSRLDAQLRQLADQVAMRLRTEGYKAIGDPAPQDEVDRTRWVASFSYKTAATRAGLGWIGKCDLFVSRELGPAVRLWSVLTDAPLAVGQPVCGRLPRRRGQRQIVVCGSSSGGVLRCVCLPSVLPRAGARPRCGARGVRSVHGRVPEATAELTRPALVNRL